MPYMKDEMKKKDSEKLDEMKEEINEAVTEEMEKQSKNDTAAADNQEESAPKQATASQPEENTSNGDSLETQLKNTQKILADTQDSFKRLQADFVNFRRRSNQEKSEISDVILQGFVKDMLPILDNFERALAVENSDNNDALKKGIEMVFNQFHETLTKNGLEVIKTEGEKFNPNFHQAVMRVENPEKEDNTIEQELQKGYMVRGRVIRPSMVKVVSN
ncbi:nucleotide exchange factor GrpE [Pectinatus sottacetonis]|uniref:nucleotide exchange factor GrpE n=1 Tax=Pectinatus sottacetonis TaxID=1002795 RepID=UPI0018C7B493|nr:nucleotide exchange factor GrpE [Pectinatus sottacetonis]